MAKDISSTNLILKKKYNLILACDMHRKRWNISCSFSCMREQGIVSETHIISSTINGDINVCKY